MSVLTLVAEEPEDPNWINEDLIWEASILMEFGYAETEEEWRDFEKYMCDHARAWMEEQHDRKVHGE